MPQPTCIPHISDVTANLDLGNVTVPTDLSGLSAMLKQLTDGINNSYADLVKQINQNQGVLTDRLQNAYQYLFNPENVAFNNISTNNINNAGDIITKTINNSSPGFSMNFHTTPYDKAYKAIKDGSFHVIDLKTYGADVGAKYCLIEGYATAGPETLQGDFVRVAVRQLDDAGNNYDDCRFETYIKLYTAGSGGGFIKQRTLIKLNSSQRVSVCCTLRNYTHIWDFDGYVYVIASIT